MAAVDELRERLPDSDEIVGAMERRRSDENFIARHFDDLLEEYRGKWIAVRGQMVIGHGKNPRALIGRLTGRGVDVSEVTLQYMRERPEALLL